MRAPPTNDEVRRIREKLARVWLLFGSYELTENEAIRKEAEQLLYEVKLEVSQIQALYKGELGCAPP